MFNNQIHRNLNWSLPFLIKRQMASKGRPAMLLKRVPSQEADSIEDELKSEDFKARKHPGIFAVKRVTLPTLIYDRIKQLLNANIYLNDIVENSEVFDRYLHERTLPIEREGYRELAIKVEERVRSKNQLVEEILSEEELKELERRQDSKIKKQLKDQIYHWKPVDYDESNKSLQYLIQRASPEYAVLYRILNEIKLRDETFEPTTLFDFGSGVGTVIWATNTIWPKLIKENYCIDISSEMIKLSETILKTNKSKEEEYIYKGIYYRQFMPSPATNRKYNLVVSSCALNELSESKLRLNTVSHLWNLTEENGYLVLIERGNSPGFKIINEVRDFLLKLHLDFKPQNIHVFSPCPHEDWCPKFLGGFRCFFHVKYKVLYPFFSDDTRRERFSYVVFKKGSVRNDYDEHWPRLVEEPLKRGGHVICRLCTKEGKFIESVFTKTKPSRMMYHCAKRSSAGDLLPIKMEEPEIKSNDK